MTIVKEKLVKAHKDPRLIAGDASEKQVAYYLKRAFGESSEVLVFNDLRIEKGTDAAQMDHLILHRNGAIIIESKSVSTRVRVNGSGEWERFYDARWQGMPSPVAQARLQGDLLRLVLNENRESLLGKIAFLQKRFVNYDIAVLVAISENGSIDRESPDLVPEATKADFICDKLKSIIERQKKAASFVAAALGKDADIRVAITEDELQKVSVFLTGAHVEKNFGQTAHPRPRAALDSVPTASSDMRASRHICTKCGSDNGGIEFGKFGYYWKCSACDGNSKLKLPGEGKIRKEGKTFYYCASDGVETKFHENL